MLNKKFLVSLMLLFGLWYVVSFIWVCVSRMGYPFELEWMEGGVLVHVLRVLGGEKLYVKPSLDFIPYIYPPLFYYFAGLISSLLGVQFLSIRLASVLATIGSCAFIYLFTKRETSSRTYGVIAICFFLSTYAISGAWLDLGRIDSLFLLFTLAAAYHLTVKAGWFSLFVAGALSFFAFFTKQNGLVVGGALGLCSLLVVKGWKSLVLPITFIVLVSSACLIMNARTQGWFSYYIFELPQYHSIVWDFLFKTFWWQDTLKHIPILVGLAGSWFLFQLVDRNWRTFIINSALLGGALVVSWSGRIHSGGYINVLIPFFAVLGIYASCGLMRLMQQLSLKWCIPLTLLVLVQFCWLFYSPSKLIPLEEDERAGNAFIEKIRSMPGDVFIPDHGYYSVMAGKRSFAQTMAVNDILRAKEHLVKDQFYDEMLATFPQRHIDGFILGDAGWHLPKLTDQLYENLGPVFEGEEEFWPITGHWPRPTTIYVRKKSVLETRRSEK